MYGFHDECLIKGSGVYRQSNLNVKTKVNQHKMPNTFLNMTGKKSHLFFRHLCIAHTDTQIPSAQAHNWVKNYSSLVVSGKLVTVQQSCLGFCEGIQSITPVTLQTLSHDLFSYSEWVNVTKDQIMFECVCSKSSCMNTEPHIPHEHSMCVCVCVCEACNPTPVDLFLLSVR